MKKTLYISDLDGTLLNHQVMLSPFTIKTLNELISQGMHFSYATARTCASTNSIFLDVPSTVPVVLMNGVLIYDRQTKHYLKVETIDKESTPFIIQTMRKHGLTGFLYLMRDDQFSTYYENLDSTHRYSFYEERVRLYNKPFTKINKFEELLAEDIIYLSILDTKENLDEFCKELSKDSNLALAFYKDIYSDNLWYAEVFSKNATKYNAVKYLREKFGYDEIIGFGDNLNDIPLFSACDKSFAVANAKQEVKDAADEVIESNVDDGVAKCMKNLFLNQ